MKNNLILAIMIVAFTNCHLNDYKSGKIKSSTGNYLIQVTVNRTDNNSDNYADVIIHIFDNNSKKLFDLNTGACDANKWAIGWTKTGDTIILQSSDIGNKAWIIQMNNPTEIKMTNKLDERAEYLKSIKY